jgi:hypothetical protein
MAAAGMLRYARLPPYPWPGGQFCYFIISDRNLSRKLEQANAGGDNTLAQVAGRPTGDHRPELKIGNGVNRDDYATRG